jgi:hypothetical protein
MLATGSEWMMLLVGCYFGVVMIGIWLVVVVY